MFAKLVLAALLLASPATALSIPFVAAINGGQVVPPTISLAFGTGVFDYDDVLNLLDLSIVTTNVLLLGPETAAQIHGPAAVGVNGPAIADIALGSLKMGSLDLSLLAACSGDVEACEADLKAGLWYVLVSSEALPEGEIRGQITPVGVPEPAGWAMGLMGLVGLAVAGWRPV